ncbi:MAG: DUF1800 family protein [Verrucomicrobiaceae bacterium]|nr:DUF1800 family protein [Verrucomicrobiaceae bacterium]
MKNRFASRHVSGLLAAVLVGMSSLQASTDNYSAGPGQAPGDGMCDIWQAIYNAWGLSPTADTDSDGCTNLVESIAGTDPRKPGDCLKVGNTIVSASTVTFYFDSEGWKKYRVKSDTTLNGPFSTIVTLTGINGIAPAPGTTEYVPPADSPPGTPHYVTVTRSPGNMRFYKLEVSDVDGDADGVSSWAENRTGLDPALADSDGDGTNDGLELNAEVAIPDVVSIVSTATQASEDGPLAGTFTVSRTRTLIPSSVNFTLSGTASNPGDFAASPSTGVTFAPGQNSQQIIVNPSPDSSVEGSESVTATLATSSAGDYTLDPTKTSATVIIANSTTATGTGLMARYYDHSSGIYAHAANFGDSANYQYVRTGSTPNFTGLAVITPTGVSPARLATLLGALTPNTTMVKFSFNGGNLNTAVYNHQNFLVTAKTAATFTIALPPGAGLPGNSTSTCFFSIQPIHPGLIERTEAVDNNWVYGTPNATTISHLNSPDNYSETFETYLHPTTAGSYRFQLDADDRARVLIDLNRDGDFDLPEEQVVEHGWDTSATVSPVDGKADDEVVGTFKSGFSIAGASTTIGSAVITVPSTDGLVVGLAVTGTGLPANEFITAVGAGQITVTTGTGVTTQASTTLTFTPVLALAVPANPSERYKMRVEHVDATGDARCRLQWSINGGGFANIPQANQFTHTQAMSWSYTAGNLVVTPTGGHSRTVGENVDLSFSSGALFRPGATSTHNGTLQISAVNGTTSFTVPITPNSTVTVPGATTVANSATVTVPSVAGLIPGMAVSGTGIPANAYIVAVGTTTITLATGTGVTAQASTTLTCIQAALPITVTGVSTTAGSQTVLVPSVDGLTVGMFVTGVGLPTNATISAINPGAILLSTATGTTTQASTTLTAFLHPTSNVTGNGFIVNHSGSTTTGVYNLIYNNTTFSGSPARTGTFQHVTEQNNGVWGSGTPDVALINPDTFSVRWSGQVQPQFTEEYTFVFQADDGCLFRFNGQTHDMRPVPGTSSGGTYFYDATTGGTIVNYVNTTIKPGSYVLGETVRLDPTSGNLSHPNVATTYTYTASTGGAVIDYSLLTAITPGSITAGQFIELDPTAGTAAALGTTRYEVLAAPAPTATTFAVQWVAGAFADQATGAAITVADTRDATITAVYPAGNASYAYTSGTGNVVVDYSTSGFAPNTFTTGMSLLLDPTSNALTTANTAGDGFGNNVYKTISAATATTFTVSYATGLGGTSTGSITLVAPALAGQPATQMFAFAVNLEAGRFANASAGNVNIETVNKTLKDWASMGNERYFRVPVVAGTRYDIEVDYYENTGNARAQLYWYSPSQPKQIIPAERLYPSTGVPQAPAAHLSDIAATALVGGPFSHTILGSNGGVISISGAPAWLTLNGNVLSGTPPTGSGGDYQILITITNGAGTSTSVLNLHVDATGGNVARELWTGITGTAIPSIPLGTAPNSTANLTSLEAPTSAAEDFGARIRGYITAPVTGNYYFWLSASDSAEFWLSNDHEVVNAFKRASVTGGGTTPQNWATAAKSPWMALEAGKRYYFEILHKSGTGDDHLALGWSKPGEATTAPSAVVPGYVISPWVAPAPGSSNGTLYIATMLSQGGAITNGVGSATFRLSEDENSAIVTYTYGGLTGVLTDWHVHNDAFLTHASSIMYDPNMPPSGSGPLPDNNPPGFTSHKWVIPPMVGTMTKAEVVELIKQGKAYINLHTAAYPNGEIRGNLTLANGSKTFTPPPAPPAWTDDSNTDTGALRFLAQASYGASIADVTALKALTPTGGGTGYPASRYEAWINAQFALPATDALQEVLRTRRADAQGGSQLDETLFFNSWWRNSITGADQLRQRLAFALSQIHVISGQGPLDNRGEALAYFYNKLAEGAFDNFREILETTTLTPAMGRYLDMKNNDKPDPAVGRIPNENYAREIKQLFAVGLYRQWPDGTLMLTSDDRPIDTYTQREIVGFAHVFTGWTDGYDGVDRTGLNAPANWLRQMRVVPARHYTGPKRVLNNEVFPGIAELGGVPLDPLATHNSTHFNNPVYQALPTQELEASHQQLFDHPNVGPFICRQLIQRMVTSHPSRDYLYRVVQKFNDRGDGVRGDMQAVIKAILLDYEARNPGQVAIPAFGKQREPLLRVAAAGRAFRPATYSGTYSQSGTRTITVNTGTPHKLANGNNVLLEFTASPADVTAVIPAPWTGTYSATVTGTTTFTIQATNYATGTYSIPANSNICTLTWGNHWLQVGNQFFIDFTSGTADGEVGLDQAVYTVATNPSPANNGDNGNSLTFTIPAGEVITTARSGNFMSPRFRPGSMQIAASGLPAPNDRRVTMRTEEDHHLKVGDQVQLNVYGSQATPQPIDVVVTVDSVIDLKGYTFLISSATTGWSNGQGNNSVYQFPLLSQPLTRSGTINSRSSSFQIGSTDGTLDQSPVNADTVFNYFLPEFKFPGSLASQGITTPEFQLTAETGVIRQANYIYDGVFNSGTTNGFSSFSSGNGALTLDYAPWLVDDATNLSLGGAPTNTTVPWTHNQNIAALIDRLSLLLTADQMPTAAKTAIRDLVALPISSISTGNPCTVTTTRPHGYTTGQSVCISGVTNGTFSNTVNSTSTARVITVTGTNTFTFLSNCTAAPTAGGLTNAHASQIIYNQGSTTPSATERRDRMRAILHLILTSPDFTIQR